MDIFERDRTLFLFFIVWKVDLGMLILFNVSKNTFEDPILIFEVL